MTNMAEHPFILFGREHLTVLGLVIVIGTWMVGTARAGKWPRLVRAQEIALAMALFACWPAKLIAGWLVGLLDAEAVLPLHLCDLAAISGAVALLTRWKLGAEFLYFWGLAGTLNGLITPTTTSGFPHPVFISFFLLHGGVVLAAFYVVLGTPLWPRPGAVRRVTLYSLAYLALISLFNRVAGTNFAFTNFKPATASLFDALGPWPIYVLALIPLGCISFLVLYAPFYFFQKLWVQTGLTSQPSLLTVGGPTSPVNSPHSGGIESAKRSRE